MRETGRSARLPRIVNEVLHVVQHSIPSGAAVIVGVSGGMDSSVLIHTLATTQDKHALRLHIAHLNHGIRGDAATRDENFVRSLAAEFGVPCIVDRVDTPSYAAKHKLSLETAARELRYTFFQNACKQAQATHVCVAHNADDQAETVLMRLIRGTGTVGLQAMHMQSPLPGASDLVLMRPLLRITRAEIEQYAHEHALHFVHDETNEDRAHLRNRIRHEVLPLLEAINPGIRQVLLHLTENAQGDAELLSAARLHIWNDLASEDVASLALDRIKWRRLPTASQRAALREGCARAKGDLQDVRHASLEEALHVLNSDCDTATIGITKTLAIHVNRHSFLFINNDKIL